MNKRKEKRREGVGRGRRERVCFVNYPQKINKRQEENKCNKREKIKRIEEWERKKRESLLCQLPPKTEPEDGRK